MQNLWKKSAAEIIKLIDKKEITNNTLEGMNREQLEKRLSELEAKIGEAKNIIDVTPEEIT